MIIDDPFEVCRRGAALPREETARWRERLRADPDDREARLVLLGASDGAERYSHALFFIEAEPTWWLMGRSTIPAGCPEYERGVALWRAAVQRHDDPSVTLNAARFVLLFEPELGLVFFELAEERHGRSRARLLALAIYIDEAVTLATARGDVPSERVVARALLLHGTLLSTDPPSAVQARVRAIVRFARLASGGSLHPRLLPLLQISNRRDLAVLELEEMRSQFLKALDEADATRG